MALKSARKSTRSVTRDTGEFTRLTAGSQSLSRGLQLLRAFRPGTGALLNAELAARTGLPRSTVSRLTRVLVDSGFLTYDLASGGYRLSAVYLSLANAYRLQFPELDVALPIMKSVALGEKINVGLAVCDHDEMIYLEALRESRRGVLRMAGPGSTFPMDTTATGRAYLAAVTAERRALLMRKFATQRGKEWPIIRRQIGVAQRDIEAHGYCAGSWQPGLMAIATCLFTPNGETCAMSISFHAEAHEQAIGVEKYAPLLLKMKEETHVAWLKLASRMVN